MQNSVSVLKKRSVSNERRTFHYRFMDRIYKELKEMKQEYTKDEKGMETSLSTSTTQCIRQLIQIVFFNFTIILKD